MEPIQQIQSKRFAIDSVGFGTYKIAPGEATCRAVSQAIEVGYRSIDTAKFYENEQDVGRAVRDSGLDIFVTTKVWNDEQGYEAALAAGRRSRDYLQKPVDLLLVHWPGKDKFLDTWQAFVQLQEEGTARHIGVSNFQPRHLELLRQSSMPLPVINQIEMSPLLTQQELRRYCSRHDILIEAWGPIVQGRVSLLQELEGMARKHGKTVAQIALRWAVEHGCRVLPKSTHRERMIENLNIFDFSLSTEEVADIDILNRNLRQGPDPDEFLF